MSWTKEKYEALKARANKTYYPDRMILEALQEIEQLRHQNAIMRELIEEYATKTGWSEPAKECLSKLKEMEGGDA